MNSDVLIIGGGIIGLSIARELKKNGVKQITILERGKIGQEASFAAAGMLAPNAETNKIDDFYRFCQQSGQIYPEFSRAILDETGIDIELEQTGTLYLALREQDTEELRQRYEWQKRAGLAVEKLSAEEVRKAESFISPDVREGLFFPQDWQVENRRLLSALAEFARLNDIEIIENTEVSELLTDGGKISGAFAQVKKFTADRIVLTTGAWTSLIKTGGFRLPQVTPVRGQIVSYQTVKRLFFHVIYSPRGYLVPRLDGKIISGATVENVGFDVQTTEAGINFVQENAVEIAPNLANLQISEKWAGLRPFAADGLPILGGIPFIENLFVATAHYRNGILLAPLTAEIMARKILENTDSDYLKSFSPARFQN